MLRAAGRQRSMGLYRYSVSSIIERLPLLVRLNCYAAVTSLTASTGYIGRVVAALMLMTRQRNRRWRILRAAGKLKPMQTTRGINLQAAKLINANVNAAALFAVVFFLYFPAEIWRILTTPFDETRRDD